MIDGLEATQRLEPGKSMTVDVLTVPHHGSENNIVDTKFVDRVIARHYIFYGDGFNGNRELEVIEVMVKQRKKALGSSHSGSTAVNQF